MHERLNPSRNLSDHVIDLRTQYFEEGSSVIKLWLGRICDINDQSTYLLLHTINENNRPDRDELSLRLNSEKFKDKDTKYSPGDFIILSFLRNDEVDNNFPYYSVSPVEAEALSETEKVLFEPKAFSFLSSSEPF